MKLKTDKEIERLSVDHANTVSDASFPEWHGREASFRRGYAQAQQDLLASASEGFEEWHKNHEYFEGILDYNETNVAGLRPINSTDVYENAKEAWQACSMSLAKKLSTLESWVKHHQASAQNAINEKSELMKKMQEKDAEIEKLKKENEELRSIIHELQNKNHDEIKKILKGEVK